VLSCSPVDVLELRGEPVLHGGATVQRFGSGARALDHVRHRVGARTQEHGCFYDGVCL
jgi:hypothetical protein